MKLSQINQLARALVIIAAFCMGACTSENSKTSKELVLSEYSDTGILWQYLSEIHEIENGAIAKNHLAEALKKSGITYPKGSATIIDPSSGILLFKNTAKNQERLVRLLDEAGAETTPRPTSVLE